MASTEELTQPKYVDFAEYILFQVRRTQTLIRQTDLMLLIASAVCGVMVTILAFVLLDHWLFAEGLPQIVRWLGWACLCGCIGGALYYFLRIVNGKEITSLYAARTLEKSDQGFANNLMTLVDLDYHGRSTPQSIRDSLERRAALTLNDLDVEHSLDRSGLQTRLYILLATTVLLFGYSFLSPKSTVDSLWRLLFPWTEVSAPTQTKILNVQPGSVEVTSGTHVEVSAYLEGYIPDQVWLEYSTADRRIVDERIELHETGEGLGKYTGLIAGENGRGVDQTTTYSLHAGDGHSSTYTLSVRPAPHAAIDSVIITPPAYTQRQAYRQPGGAIDGLEGSEVTLQAQTNIAIAKAWIQLYQSEDPTDRGGQLPLTISDETKINGQWPLRIQDDGTYPRFYSIECETADGSRDSNPPLHAILIRPDERPEVKLIDPKTDLSRPINVSVPLLIEAYDPDFLLSGLSVQVEKQGQIISSELIDATGQQALRTKHVLELERLPVVPGETIAFWIEARDNRLPHPNRRQTPKLRIQITDAIDPAQAEQQEKQEEQRQEEMQQDRPAPENPEKQPEPEQEMTEEQPEQSPTENTEPGEDENQQDGGTENSQNKKPGAEQTNDSEKDSEKNGEKSDKPGKADENKKEGAADQEPKFSPDGDEDDLVLEKMIERMQEEQKKNKDNPSNPEDKPGDNPDPNQSKSEQPNPDSAEQKPEPNATQPPSEKMPPEQDPTKNTPPENNTPSDQNSPPSETSPNEDSMKEPGKETNPDSKSPENPEKNNPAENNPMPEPGNESENMKPDQNSSEKDPNAPADSQKPTSENMKEGPPDQETPADGNQSPTSEKPEDGSAETKKPADGTEPPNAEKTPAKEPGKGESKPGEGNEQGPTERENNPEMKPPQSENPQTPPSDQKPNSSDKDGSSSKPDPNSPSKKGDSNSKPDASKPGEKSEKPTGDKPKSGSEKSPNESSKKPSGEEAMKPSDKPADPDAKTKEETDPKSPDGKPGGESAKPNSEEKPTNPPGEKPPVNPEDMQKPDDSDKPEGDKPENAPNQKPGENKQGPSEKSPQDSKSPPSKGKPGEGEGEGKEGQSDKPGQGKKGDKPGKPSQQSGPADGSQPSTPQEGGKANGGDMKGDPKNTAQPGNADGSPENSTENEYTLEDRRKAAELVLDKIEDDLKRGEVDEELLEELNWSKDNLKQFQERLADYLRNQNETAAEPDLKQKQFNEMLRNMQLQGERKTREGAAGGREGLDEFAPTMAPAPPEYRELEEAFRRSLSESGAAE